MVHSSSRVSSRSRGTNPRSPPIANGYSLVLLLSALATAVAYPSTSLSIVDSTEKNASALQEQLATEAALGWRQNGMKAFQVDIMNTMNSVCRRKEQRHHGDSSTRSSTSSCSTVAAVARHQPAAGSASTSASCFAPSVATLKATFDQVFALTTCVYSVFVHSLDTIADLGD